MFALMESTLLNVSAIQVTSLGVTRHIATVRSLYLCIDSSYFKYSNLTTELWKPLIFLNIALQDKK